MPDTTPGFPGRKCLAPLPPRFDRHPGESRDPATRLFLDPGFRRGDDTRSPTPAALEYAEVTERSREGLLPAFSALTAANRSPAPTAPEDTEVSGIDPEGSSGTSSGTCFQFFTFRVLLRAPRPLRLRRLPAPTATEHAEVTESGSGTIRTCLIFLIFDLFIFAYRGGGADTGASIGTDHRNP